MLKGPFSTKKTITRNKKNMKEKNLSGKVSLRQIFTPFGSHTTFASLEMPLMALERKGLSALRDIGVTW